MWSLTNPDTGPRMVRSQWPLTQSMVMRLVEREPVALKFNPLKELKDLLNEYVLPDITNIIYEYCDPKLYLFTSDHYDDEGDRCPRYTPRCELIKFWFAGFAMKTGLMTRSILMQVIERISDGERRVYRSEPVTRYGYGDDYGIKGIDKILEAAMIRATDVRYWIETLEEPPCQLSLDPFRAYDYYNTGVDDVFAKLVQNSDWNRLQSYALSMSIHKDTCDYFRGIRDLSKLQDFRINYYLQFPELIPRFELIDKAMGYK